MSLSFCTGLSRPCLSGPVSVMVFYLYRFLSRLRLCALFCFCFGHVLVFRDRFLSRTCLSGPVSVLSCLYRFLSCLCLSVPVSVMFCFVFTNLCRALFVCTGFCRFHVFLYRFLSYSVLSVPGFFTSSGTGREISLHLHSPSLRSVRSFSKAVIEVIFPCPSLRSLRSFSQTITEIIEVIFPSRH